MKRFTRRQLIAYAALALVIIAVGVRYLILDERPSKSGEQLVLTPVVSPSASAGPAAGGSPAPATLVVHVCGAVRRPGIVTLPADSRAADAIEAAGGVNGKADLTTINLAAKVADGQQVIVAERGQAPAAGAAPAGQGGSAATGSGGSATGGAAAGLAGPISINSASASQLDALPGVGPATAQKIIDYRTANGPFKTLEDLKNVPGIGDVRFAALKAAISL